jgi:hypothetical protein
VLCVQFGRGIADGKAARPWASCRCVPPTVTGESRNGSSRCGGGRHTLAGACLPPSWASLGTAPHGVAAAGNPVTACWCAPPTVVGEYRIGSTQCGGGRQAPLRLGMDVSRCMPPTVVGESSNGSTRCGVGRLPPPLAKHGCLPVHPLHLWAGQREHCQRF